MKTARILTRFATRIMPVLFLLALLIPTGAAQAPAPNPSSPGPDALPSAEITAFTPPPASGAGMFYVTGLEFTPFTTTTLYTHFGVGIANASPSLAYFDGPIYLPHGAKITQFVVYFIDNNVENDMIAYLGYQNVYDQFATVVSTLTSSGASSAVRYMATSVINPNIADLVNRGWLTWVGLQPDPTMYLIGVRVDYEYETMLPTILQK